MNAALIVLLLLAPLAAAAEIVEYPGNPDVLPDERFVRVVSEEASPVQQTYIKARDGVYIAAAIRKPRGRGPFPGIVPNLVEGGRAAVLKPGSLRESSKPLTP